MPDGGGWTDVGYGSDDGSGDPAPGKHKHVRAAESETPTAFKGVSHGPSPRSLVQVLRRGCSFGARGRVGAAVHAPAGGPGSPGGAQRSRLLSGLFGTC